MPISNPHLYLDCMQNIITTTNNNNYKSKETQKNAGKNVIKYEISAGRNLHKMNVATTVKLM